MKAPTMKLLSYTAATQRQMLLGSMSAALLLLAAEHVRAATPETDMADAVSTSANAHATKIARRCMKDLNAFQAQLQKDGYWRGGSSFGYGYPMHGYGNDYSESTLAPVSKVPGESTRAVYWSARPGYDVRTLVAAAQILAQRGRQAPCEALLGETREIYGQYKVALRNGHVPKDNPSGWRQAHLAAARPVTGQDVSYRSDQLIGTEVLNPKGDTLGSVDDLVLSPNTGKIAYLVVGRGGLFGIDEKYVPVPWADFKATAGTKLLVLDSNKGEMAAAPHVREDRFSAADDFATQSQQIDAYWSAHLAK